MLLYILLSLKIKLHAQTFYFDPWNRQGPWEDIKGEILPGSRVKTGHRSQRRSTEIPDIEQQLGDCNQSIYLKFSGFRFGMSQKTYYMVPMAMKYAAGLWATGGRAKRSLYRRIQPRNSVPKVPIQPNNFRPFWKWVCYLCFLWDGINLLSLTSFQRWFCFNLALVKIEVQREKGRRLRWRL